MSRRPCPPWLSDHRVCPHEIRSAGSQGRKRSEESRAPRRRAPYCSCVSGIAFMPKKRSSIYFEITYHQRHCKTCDGTRWELARARREGPARTTHNAQSTIICIEFCAISLGAAAQCPVDNITSTRRGRALVPRIAPPCTPEARGRRGNERGAVLHRSLLLHRSLSLVSKLPTFALAPQGMHAHLGQRSRSINASTRCCLG